MSITISAPSGASASFPQNTLAGDALQTLCHTPEAIAALFNNDLVSLSDPLPFGGTLQPVLPSDEHGTKVFERTACFLLTIASRQALPDSRLRIHNAAGTLLYCTLSPTPTNETETITRISATLHDLIAANFPIEKFSAPYLDVLQNLDSFGYLDKANLLRHRNDPAVTLVSCNNLYDLWHSPLAPSTRFLHNIRLTPASPSGFFLDLDPSSPHNPNAVASTITRAHEHIRWGDILGIHTVGDLNAAIVKDHATNTVQMVEALHDQRLAQIAASIASHTPTTRLVLIAGPSSAGKTTTSRRLATHLRILGLHPILLGTDDYFLPPAQTPIDPTTNTPDFEHLQALDLPALNADLNALLAGSPVPHRTYNFLSQKPVYTGESYTLPPDGILLIEGLHALNPLLTNQVPDPLKFRLFLNAMTSLGLDETTRVSTTDNRLLRRLIRDYRTRGKNPLETLRSWPQVRRGEERWIFPFQPLANDVFNTALEYELAVLRPLAEPLLSTLKPNVPEYATARRLLRLLANFHSLGSRRVPSDSILRETIGESLFE